MIEPGVRYHAPLQGEPITSHITLEAAVDLTIKSERWRPHSAEQMDHEDAEYSDSETPLDMSVTATRLTPVFPGFSRDHSPARSDRSDMLTRLPGLYSPGSGFRDWSTERSESVKGIYHQSYLLLKRKKFLFIVKLRFWSKITLNI